MQATDSRIGGLLAGVGTHGTNTALSLAARIEAGQIRVNPCAAGGGVERPFGGCRRSACGRGKGLGALASHTQVTNVRIRHA